MSLPSLRLSTSTPNSMLILPTFVHPSLKPKTGETKYILLGVHHILSATAE
jgi:hypothetical protein